MKEKVVIIGASGHGKVIADIIVKSDDMVVGFLDDNPDLNDEFIGFPVLGKVSEANKYHGYKFVIAIGNATIRERISNELNVEWYTAIHPTAVVSSIDVEINEGTVVMANAVINSDSKIGRHCIINTGAIVEHDNNLGDFVHVSIGAKLAGNVKVGHRTWIGVGASVINNMQITNDCMIGAGAVVVRELMESGQYIGVPARKIK